MRFLYPTPPHTHSFWVWEKPCFPLWKELGPADVGGSLQYSSPASLLLEAFLLVHDLHLHRKPWNHFLRYLIHLGQSELWDLCGFVGGSAPAASSTVMHDWKKLFSKVFLILQVIGWFRLAGACPASLPPPCPASGPLLPPPLVIVSFVSWALKHVYVFLRPCYQQTVSGSLVLCLFGSRLSTISFLTEEET